MTLLYDVARSLSVKGKRDKVKLKGMKRFTIPFSRYFALNNSKKNCKL